MFCAGKIRKSKSNFAYWKKNFPYSTNFFPYWKKNNVFMQACSLLNLRFSESRMAFVLVRILSVRWRTEEIKSEMTKKHALCVRDFLYFCQLSEVERNFSKLGRISTMRIFYLRGALPWLHLLIKRKIRKIWVIKL